MEFFVFFLDASVPLGYNDGSITLSDAGSGVNSSIDECDSAFAGPSDAASQAVFAALVDSMPNAVFYKSSDGLYAICNEAYAALLGRPRSDIIGCSDFDLFPKRVADKLFRWSSALLDGEGEGATEIRLPVGGRPLATVILRGAALRDALGNYSGFVGSAIDVTEERRAESERATTKIMAAAAEMAIQTIEGMIDPVIILDGSGRVERVNRGYVELFGLANSVVGRAFSSVFVDLSESEAEHLLRRCKDLGRIRDLEGRVRDGSGRVLPVLANLSVLRDSQRVVDGFVLAIRDVSSLLDANNRLLENERTMEAIINASEDAVFLVDREGVIRAGNRALAERFGESPATIIGKRLGDLPDREIHPVRGHFIDRIRLQGKPERMEYELGDKVFYNSGFPIFDADGAVREVAVFSYDITERKQGERLQRALYSISEAAYFAHDMQNLFALVHRIVARLVPADHFAIVLYDEATGKMDCPYSSGDGDGSRGGRESGGAGCGKIGVGLVERLLEEGRPLLLRAEDIRRLKDEGVAVGEEPFPREWLGVPLRNGESAIIGALVSRVKKPGPSYSDEDRKIVNFVSSQIAMAIERKRNEEELRTKNAMLKSLTDGTILALVRAVEIRDPYTAGHQQRVSRLAYTIADSLGLSEERKEATRIAALLHDVGKISVPSELLSKPGRLSELEFQLIKQHPISSADILKSIDFPYPIARFVREHHEKLDGTGYPDALVGDQISLESRIICVADVADAMVSHRPYRPSLGLELALDELLRNSGTLYDPEVVSACHSVFSSGSFTLDLITDEPLRV